MRRCEPTLTPTDKEEAIYRLVTALDVVCMMNDGWFTRACEIYLMRSADDVTSTFNNIIPMNMLLNISFLIQIHKTFHFSLLSSIEIGQRRRNWTFFCYDKSGRHSHTNLWSVVKSPRELTKKETREFSPKFRRWVNASFLYPFGANSGEYWFFLPKRASCYQFLLCVKLPTAVSPRVVETKINRFRNGCCWLLWGWKVRLAMPGWTFSLSAPYSISIVNAGFWCRMVFLDRDF